MANRDHSLDDAIIRAAYEEFLSCGFQKASLHKIAEKAGVTTGAIYTRYKNKNALFVSLLHDFIDKMKELFAPRESEYGRAIQLGTVDALMEAIEAEERTFLELLTEHYDDSTLFFSRSEGSSVEKILKERMESKAVHTVQFFRQAYGKEPNADAIRLLLGAQFWYFQKMLEERMEKEEMIACLQVVLDFSNAGWRQFCNTLL